MKRPFDAADEDHLRETFITARGGTIAYPVNVRSVIRRSCLAFREVFPGDSILNHTHSTQWVLLWNARQPSRAYATRLNQLMMLGQWWQWLFKSHVIDNNVLEFVSCRQLARDLGPRLTLHCNLQRHIAEYLESRSDLRVRSREYCWFWLKRFNIFVNRVQPIEGSAAKLDVGEEALGSWFRSVQARGRRRDILDAAGILSPFFDFLVSRGVLAENPLKRSTKAFPASRASVVFALVGVERPIAVRATCQPVFRSFLAERMNSFRDLKRGAGCRREYGLTNLRAFDRFLVAHGEHGPVTNALLARWWASCPDLAPGTRRQRWSLIRQFCLYLRRDIPETCVPDSFLGRLPSSGFRPQIIQPHEMKALLAAVETVVRGVHWILRPRIFRMLLELLYATGLRVSEARALQVSDVDLRERIITIRQTKFYKARLVPFSDGLLALLREYHRERLRLVGASAPNAPFFPTMNGGHYSKHSVDDVWQGLVKSAGLRAGGARGPRIHDLRHSFATLRLAAWYREGVDVDAMLPRLATYLGHVNVASTYVYLTILPETLLAASERFRRYSGSVVASGADHALA